MLYNYCSSSYCCCKKLERLHFSWINDDLFQMCSESFIQGVLTNVFSMFKLKYVEQLDEDVINIKKYDTLQQLISFNY